MSERTLKTGCADQLFTVQSLIPRARIGREFLLTCAQLGAAHIKRRIGQINFIIVGDRTMARLHRQFIGARGTTDVITFDLTDRRGHVEGDIVICLDQARRQAKDYHVPLSEEIARLAVHGVLHLAGYSDATDRGRATMRRLEDHSLNAGKRR